jgi:hypothetical protein
MRLHAVTRLLGRSGVTGAAIWACKSTLKAEEAIEESIQDIENVKELRAPDAILVAPLTNREYNKELMLAYSRTSIRFLKLYGPPVALGALSIAALTGSHVQLTRRNTGLTVALASATNMFREYRERVRGELGIDREREIYHNIEDREVLIDGERFIDKVIDKADPSQYAKFFDEFSTQWEPDNERNRLFLMTQQEFWTQFLTSRGHVFLNEVYDSLGLPRTQAGAVVGWLYGGPGDDFVSFGLFENPNHRFIQGMEQSVLLDFNVNGPILRGLKE